MSKCECLSTTNQAGWYGPIKDFVEEDKVIVRKALESFIEDASQIRAWRDSIPMLQRVFGRRPDVLVLERRSNSRVQGKERWDISDVDQAIGYKKITIQFVKMESPCTRYFGDD